MEQRQPALKMEELLDDTGLLGRTPLTESRVNGHPRPATKKIAQASTTVLVEAIPDDVEPGMILSSEPRVFEGLNSMHLHRGPPRTASLVYSATVFAEAMLYRSASSLNEEFGMKLSLVPCHQEETRPSSTAAVEHPTVMSQTPTPQTTVSQTSFTKPSSNRQPPPGIGSSGGNSLVADTRGNKSGDSTSPSASSPSTARLYQPCTPRNLAARNSILAASRLGAVNYGNVSLPPVNTTPHSTAALSSATIKTTLPPTPTNSTPQGTITVATSSLPPTNTHPSSTPSNIPSNGTFAAISPAITTTSHSTAHVNSGSTFRDTRSSLPMTRPQQKFLMTGIQRISKRKVALLFAEPVKDSQLSIMGIGNYLDVITKPMDLRTMEEKLKNAQYGNIDEYVADFAQLVENTVRFNGPDHPVTYDAYELKDTFEKQVRDALQTFTPDAEKAQPIPKHGRPRKYRKFGEEVMELVDVKKRPLDSDSDEAAYVPRTHHRRSTGRGSSQYARRGVSS